jgi:hypothetical protein
MLRFIVGLLLIGLIVTWIFNGSTYLSAQVPEESSIKVNKIELRYFGLRENKPLSQPNFRTRVWPGYWLVGRQPSISFARQCKSYIIEQWVWLWPQQDKEIELKINSECDKSKTL